MASYEPRGRTRQPAGREPFPQGPKRQPEGAAEESEAPAASAFDIVIDKTLTVTQGGVPREVTVEEALQQRTYQEAIAGSRPARREVLKMIAKRESIWPGSTARSRSDVRVPHRAGPRQRRGGAADPRRIAGDPRGDAPGFDDLQLLLEPGRCRPRFAAAAVASRSPTRAGFRDRALHARSGSLRWPRGTRE